MTRIYRQHRNIDAVRGFTLVEVMVGAVIFLFGFQAATMGYGVAENIKNEALAKRYAAEVANHVATRLYRLGDSDCIGTGNVLTQDTINGNDMMCFGNGIDNIPGQQSARCVPDHPVNNAELGLVAGSVIGDADSDKIVVVSGNGSNNDLDNLVLRYQNYRYRVVWNIECDTSDSAKQLRVIVGYKPDDAIAKNNFVSVSTEMSAYSGSLF